MKNSMPPGPVMIDVQGAQLSHGERDRIRHPNTGGVILFSRNCQSAEQVEALVNEIRAARRGPLLIAVDQEGGRVQRFRDGFTRLPPASVYGGCERGPRGEGLAAAAAAGWLMASELLAVGIDFSFAPVLDVDCDISQVIGDRAFAQDAESVAALAGAFRRGMKRAGMAAVGKHFPGHGAVGADSHLALPVDHRSLATIEANDLLPFRVLIGQGLEGVMTAHVVYAEVDVQPAGFSAFWIHEMLRGRMGFDGAVFSDDLSMEGAACAGDYGERAKLSLAAGCDMVLVCNHPVEAERVLEGLPLEENGGRTRRLMAMARRQPVDRKRLWADEEWQRAVRDIRQLWT